MSLAALIPVMFVLAVPPQKARSAPVSVDMVRELAGRGDMEAARKAAEQVVKLTPRDGEAWYVLGFVRAGLQDLSGAIEAYRSAARYNPRHADAWNNLGDLLRRTGQLQDARSALQQGRRADPKDPRLALNMALVQIQLRDFASALRALDDVEAVAGRSTLTDYLRARTYLENGQAAMAQPHVERFRLATPQNTEGFLDLARLLLARGEYRHAAELLQTLKPESHEAATHFTLGQAFYAMDQMEKAREVFVELAARQPASALYLTWSGHAHRALGATAEARAAYERAVRADGSSAEALTELANLELDAGNSADAEALSSRALTISPDDSRTLFIAGQVLFRLQRWPDAIRILGKIQPEEVEYAQAQYMLSRAFRQAGDTVKAEAALAEFKKVSASVASMETLGRKRVK